MNQSNQPNIAPVNMDNYPNKKCPCGSEIYEQSYFVREIPPLVVGNKHPLPCLIPVVVCKKCHQPRYLVPAEDLPMAVPYKKPELNI